MHIGLLQFELLIRHSQSLKDKRRVVKSVKDRLHREHQVSAAEVGALEHHRLALMGVSVVAGDAARCSSVLDAVTDKLRGLHDAELGETVRRVTPFERLVRTLAPREVDADGASELSAGEAPQLAAELLAYANDTGLPSDDANADRPSGGER
jgi:hypothetical protein